MRHASVTPIGAIFWLIVWCSSMTGVAIGRVDYIPDFEASMYAPQTYDPYDLELLSDHCTEGVPLGDKYASSKWWIDLLGSSLYIGGFCDNHDYCYISSGYAKKDCDTHFYEQMETACHYYYHGAPSNLTLCLSEAALMYTGVASSTKAAQRYDDKQMRRDDWNTMNYDPDLGFTDTSGRKSWFIRSEAEAKRLTISGADVILSDSTPTWSASTWRYYIDESIRPYLNVRRCLTYEPPVPPGAFGRFTVDDCKAPNRYTVGYTGTDADLRPNLTQRFGHDSVGEICVYEAAYCSDADCATQNKTSCAPTDTCIGVDDAGALLAVPCSSQEAAKQWQFVAPAGLLGFEPHTLWIPSYSEQQGGWDTTNNERVVADVDGDGKADVVGFGDSAVWVSTSSGSFFRTPQVWKSDGFTKDDGSWTATYPRRVADVNGDGLADIVGFGANGVYVSLSDGTRFGPHTRWIAQYDSAHLWDTTDHERVVADVNGDGKADIVGFADTDVFVSLSNGTSFGALQVWKTDGFTTGAGGWNATYPRRVADVNGDGLADIVGFGFDGVYVSLSNGAHFGAHSRWIADYGAEQGYDTTDHERVVADVDGDGKADIVAFGNLTVYVSRSNGNSFGAPEVWYAEGFTKYAGGWGARYPRRLADVNGDGSADIVGFGSTGVYVSLAPCTGQCVRCGDGSVDPGEECDDGNLCTIDSCDPVVGCQHLDEPLPAGLCLTAEKIQFQVKNPGDPAKGQMKWKWTKGEGFLQAALGSPDTTTTYALCVYDTTASVARLATSLTVEPSSTWVNKDPKGWDYKDKEGGADGIQKLQLRTGPDRKTKAQVKARGVSLPLPTPISGAEFFDQDPSVTVQLRSSDGMCLTTEFDAASTGRNDATQFKAKVKQP